MTLHSKTGEISGKNFMTRFCRGTLAKTVLMRAYHQQEASCDAIFFWPKKCLQKARNDLII